MIAHLSKSCLSRVQIIPSRNLILKLFRHKRSPRWVFVSNLCSETSLNASQVNQVDSDQKENTKRFQLPSDWATKYDESKGVNFPGKVYLIQSEKDEIRYKDVLDGLLKEKALGFDSEHYPLRSSEGKWSFHVGLVQLATHNEAFLWKLTMRMKVPHYLQSLLTADIFKVGHSCIDDAVMISKQFNVDPINLVDTEPWAKNLNCIPKSLQGLSVIFLGDYISKKYQRSNWNKQYLSAGQKLYAATDAWISLRLYEEMERCGKELGVTLSPMYKNVQQYYDELQETKRLRNKRQRQRQKLKKKEKALEENIKKKDDNEEVLIEESVTTKEENIEKKNDNEEVLIDKSISTKEENIEKKNDNEELLIEESVTTKEKNIEKKNNS